LLFRNIEEKDVYNKIREIKNLSLCSHRDADGAYSAAIFSSVFNISGIEFPELFGDYDDRFHISLDLGEPLGEWHGIAIDHHVHSEREDYSLIWDQVPTGLVLFKLFRDRIPEKEYWKVAGSLVGDMQSFLIPLEIFQKCPILLEKRGTVYKDNYGNLKTYSYFVYKLLASPVNASCRTGKATTAFEIIKRSESPDDILSNPVFMNDQREVNSEIDSVIKELGKDRKRNTTILKDTFVIVPISSRFFIASRIASALADVGKDMVFIVVNEDQKEISIRGDLTSMIVGKLREAGIMAGGHAEAAGGSLGDKTFDDVVEALRKSL